MKVEVPRIVTLRIARKLRKLGEWHTAGIAEIRDRVRVACACHGLQSRSRVSG